MDTEELSRVLSNIEENIKIETLEEVMKIELLLVAFKKFTLTELEEKLGGTKYSL
jgi:hypothetical protein